MPSIFSRRRPADSSGGGLDLRRHSSLLPEHAAVDAHAESRVSEQLPRKPSTGDFLKGLPANNSTPAINESAKDNDRPISPPIQEQSNEHRRFSMLKFRHASESQLSVRARMQSAKSALADMPKPPEIITTAPTVDFGEGTSKKKAPVRLPGRTYTSSDSLRAASEGLKVEALSQKDRRSTMSESGASARGRVTFDEPGRPVTQGSSAPPAYGDENGSQLALPVNRLSESSRSDGSGDQGIYATTTTTHTVHTTTTFFRLPRRKKQGPLFPLPQRVIPPEHGSSLAIPTGSGSTSISSVSPGSESPAVAALRMPPPFGMDGRGSNELSSPSHSTLLRTSLSFAAMPGSPMDRQPSTASNKSSPPKRLGMRGRSSTLSSLRNMPSDDALPTPTMASTRTSTSTGRKSFGDLFGLSHRLRQNSEPPFHPSGPNTPRSDTSKNNSMQLTREPVVIPERLENESPATYLVRLEEAVSRGVVASVLCKGTDAFSAQVLRSYMRGFAFFEDPMDMAIRKLLMEVELPKETQQIDRCLQSFANRYHECNPGIYASPDQAYFIAFSILILHTDVFNKNNKHKMQRADYIKNTKGEGIFEEILECFYDNISYTPFIHVEDDIDINGERIIQLKGKKKTIFPRSSTDPVRRPLKEPIDPYTLIIDKQLEYLRPNLKDVMHLEEHYNYLGTAASLNMRQLLDTFFRTGVLQIKSSRSRPDAFLSDKTITNPEEANPGVVEIKVTKVGLLWRKDVKKKKARSPWQEWGAILTGAQLYFFRNTTWVKSLMHQQEQHVKKGLEGIPVTFSPPIEQFKPDALMSTDDAVALLDSTYTKHKHAFLFVRHGGFEETFLADNQDEMNDWMAKLNYAAAFRTAGVRMRGILGGNYDGQRTRGIRRLDSLSSSSGATNSIQTPTGEVTIVRSKIDNKMAQDIMAARREIMQQRIVEWEDKLSAAVKQLDAQLRNARHLQILAPIQAKTRDHVLSAAGRMSARLKWMRVEIWRLRCHRDILIRDLDEEMLSPSASPAKVKPGLAPDSELARLNSKASIALTAQASARSPEIRPLTQPTPMSESEFGMGDIFTTPPALVSASSFHKSQATWELPPLVFDGINGRKGSVGSNLPNSPLSHTSSFPSIRPITTAEPQRAVSNPQHQSEIDAVEQAVLEQAGFVTSEAAAESDSPTVAETPESKRQSATDKDKLDRSKIRRSLHRTLRDAHVPSHHRNKKGRDSSSTANSDDTVTAEAASDVLVRGKGSFTVHGKKASVITFGEELSNMSPDERMRLRRSAHRDDYSSSSLGRDPASIEDDFHSLLVEPVQYREHRDSTASASTATARSFSELHKRLSVHAANAGTRTQSQYSAEEDDSEAISFSDGRRTPLPPVEDMDENDEQDRISVASSAGKQASFYSPNGEQARSPVSPVFKERTSVQQDVLEVMEGEGKGKGKEAETDG